MELSKVHHLDFLDNKLPDTCASLIIADPPYYRVKGDFDFIWASFDEYLEDVERWALECKRILADNGTLFWYGDRKNIAYAQVILDRYFDFQNNIYWQKAEKCQMEMFNTLRSFYCRGFERILFYSNSDDFNLTNCIFYIRDYIRGEIEKARGGVVLSDINRALGTATNGGGVASACFSLEKSEPTMVTEEMYKKLQDWCYPYLRREYEDLRREYEDLRRPFNNFMKLSDHWHFTNAGSDYSTHDTPKPEKMTRAMILTCTRPGDLVVVPFAGSGTECAMAVKEQRRFVGFEIDAKHVKTATERVKAHTAKPVLFAPEQMYYPEQVKLFQD